MIIGAIANFCGYEAAMSCIKGVAVKSGTKIIDKLAIPVGAFLIASLVGDKVQEYTEEKVVEVKNTVAEIRDARVKTSDEFCEEVVNNIFEDKEVVEDGDSENAE